MVKEFLCLRKLTLLDFDESITENARLFFNVLERESRVGLKMLEALMYGFEERLLSTGAGCTRLRVGSH
jgi:hypothetical protein